MRTLARVSLFSVLALLAVDDCPAADGRRPRSGVVGTFGTLNSIQPRSAPAQSSRRPSVGGRPSASRGGTRGAGSTQGMSGQGMAGQGVMGMAGISNGNSLSGISGASGSNASNRRSTGRQSSPYNPATTSGSQRTNRRNKSTTSVRSSLPPANSQR